MAEMSSTRASWIQRGPLKDYHQNSNEEDENLFFDLIQQMLAYDPDQRLSLTAALKHPFFDKIASSA